eukprot:m51a1_g1927 putative bipolar kinesin krp- (1038) ;mRNA; f:875628-879638
MTSRDLKGNAGVNIQVACRCRPLSAAEAAEEPTVDCNPGMCEITVNHRLRQISKRFLFDRVYGPDSTQNQVYEDLAAPIVAEVLQGFNCTIFAYGQTGTGKTYTMEGDPENEGRAGIIPRAITDIFDTLQQSGVEAQVRVSHLELYNEEINDLLAQTSVPPEKPVRIYEDPKTKTVCVVGVEEIPVADAAAIFAVLEKSTARRKTAATAMNPNSSRSHCIFTVSILTKELTPDGEELIKVGKLNLVDLAGSENMSRAGTSKSDTRKKETSAINQSLLTLGRVIDALCQHNGYVPYRDSKLTRLLQESLGGRTKTCIIATFSPASSSIEETLSTLEYAFRAKNIRNKPEVNQKVTRKALMREQVAEITRLRDELKVQREKQGVYLKSEDFSRMETEIEEGKALIELLETQLQAAEKNLQQLQDLSAEDKRRLAQEQEKNERTTTLLRETQEQLDASRVWQTEAQKRLEENAACIAKQQQTEKELRDTGNRLLSDFDGAITQVRLLHEKLDRMRRLEEENKKKVEDFKRYVNSRVTALVARTTALSEQQKSLGTTVAGPLSSFVNQRAADFALQKQRTHDSCDLLAKTQERDDADFGTQQAAAVEALQAFLADTEEHDGRVGAAIDGCAEKTTAEAEALESAVVVHREQTCAFTSSWANETAAIGTALAELLDATNSTLSSFHAAVVSRTEEVASSNAAAQKRAQEIAAEHQRQAEELEARLLECVRQQMAEMREQQAAALAAVGRELAGACAQSGAACGRALEDSEALRTHIAQTSSAHQAALQLTLEASRQRAEECTCAVEAFAAGATSGAQAMSAAAQACGRDVRGLREDARARFAGHAGRCGAAVESLAETYRATWAAINTSVAPVVTDCERQSAESERACAEQGCALAEGVSAAFQRACDEAMGLTQDIAQVGRDTFATLGVRVDDPTGQTPLKAHIPRKDTAYERVIQSVRLNLAETFGAAAEGSATATPSPSPALSPPPLLCAESASPPLGHASREQQQQQQQRGSTGQMVLRGSGGAQGQRRPASSQGQRR